MELVDLLKKANKGYTDGFLTEYFNEETGQLKAGFGDTLAKFIVVELTETFEDEAGDEEQTSVAIRCLECARDELQSVINALLE